MSNENPRVAVVSGAARGIGAAIAQRLASDGLAIGVLDLDEAACAGTVDAIKAAGGKAVAIGADVSDEASVESAISRLADELGGPTVVVNNAGITRDNMLFKMPVSEFDAVLNVHLRGAFLLTKAAQKYMVEAKWGRIVNMSSVSALGNRGQANYSAAKAGIVALTLSANQGLSRYGVTSNAIAPRARTEMTSHVFAGDPDASRELDILAPERVGTFVSYLASPAAAGISGQVFVVYGDMVALMDSPKVERKFTAESGTFSTDELAARLGPHFEGRSPYQTYAAYSVAELDTTGVENIAN